MTATTKVAGMGIVLAQLAINSTAGYPMGLTGTVSAGSTAGAALTILSGITAAGGRSNPPDEISSTGDNHRTRHKWQIQAAEIASLDLSLIHFDADIHAAITGNTKRTISDWTFVGMDGNTSVGDIQGCLILTLDAQEATRGSSFGIQRYLNLVYPILTLQSLFADLQQAQAAEFQIRATPTAAGKFPWGEAFNVTTDGSDTKVRFGWYTRDYPGTLHTFVENGTTTSYTLGYTPAGTAGSNYIKAWKNGTQNTNGFSITTSTKNFAITTVGSSGDVWVVPYEATDILG